MLKKIRAIAANIKLTTAIVWLVVTAIVFSTAAMILAVYMNLGTQLREQAIDQQHSDLRAAATILANSMPGTEASWSESGELEGIVAWALPRLFINHDIVDSVVRMTGESATIFSWDAEQQDFVRMSTTIVDVDGERIIGSTMGSASPAYAAISEGRSYFGEATILGTAYYTAYQPILGHEGQTIGALYVGVDRAKVDNTISQLLFLLLKVGAGVLVVVGLIGFAMSRLLLAPVPRLAGVMDNIATGDLETAVPYVERNNEVGAMAKAVEVFRQNGLKMAEMTEEERAAAQRRRIERTDMMVALQAAFGEVVDAAIAGDFSKRVHAQFADAELNSLATSVNMLVETVDRGLSETGEVLSHLAQADLTHRMTGEYQGAFAELSADTNGVADKLSEVIGRLRTTSRALKVATGEILSGANDLSERTTKQAATIEETSAAMEQLASTVASNADLAGEAGHQAQSVSKEAEEAGSVMGQANDAMERITQSSSKISNIIGMIDDIAFQTNLLALNASVEAARAGEAGKGFAVVAVEVRRLAQSAAQASAEVKELIEKSAQEVSGGSRLVSTAAQRLESMLGAVARNAEMMQTIAKASKEQARAIDEVGSAVRTLDEMTQHNAALVEQTNAAIEQTEAQAGELDRVVDTFTLAESEAPVRRAAPRAPAPQTFRSQGNAAISADWDEF
ncbi:methyl-accepting chemotaxis protein [Devosia crocina]|uniref:Methyl-accepting chemotaxis protein n=1 Tax=Devosia crocina TaxID=429728 RepID=A0A1I7NR92_9HYPH|nr:methyl-accepting chemotaxis protein [Devosia crocina]SFV37143.1 methyl-accepting chemotaxis protein [Devosia crocina]